MVAVDRLSQLSLGLWIDLGLAAERLVFHVAARARHLDAGRTRERRRRRGSVGERAREAGKVEADRARRLDTLAQSLVVLGQLLCQSALALERMLPALYLGDEFALACFELLAEIVMELGE